MSVRVSGSALGVARTRSVRLLALACVLIAVAVVAFEFVEVDPHFLTGFLIFGFGFLQAFLGFYPGISWVQPYSLLVLLVVAFACGVAVLALTRRSDQPERRLATAGIITACFGLVLGGLGYVAAVGLVALVLASLHLARPPGRDGVAVHEADAEQTEVSQNRLAEVGLAVGILAGPLGCVAILLGYASLRRIRKTGEEGRRMAIAGIVLGWYWVVFDLIAVWMWISIARSVIE